MILLYSSSNLKFKRKKYFSRIVGALFETSWKPIYFWQITDHPSSFLFSNDFFYLFISIFFYNWKADQMNCEKRFDWECIIRIFWVIKLDFERFVAYVLSCQLLLNFDCLHLFPRLNHRLDQHKLRNILMTRENEWIIKWGMHRPTLNY